MNVSKIKMVLNWLVGGFSGVVEYLLEVLNETLGKISPENKQKIQAGANIAKKVLASLNAVAWLCPEKWQTAYEKTVRAVADVVESLEDLELTMGELTKIRQDFTEAVCEWSGGDDETCVDAKALK